MATPVHRFPLSATQRGLLWVVLAGVAFVGFLVIVRFVGNELHPVQAAFIRYGLGLLVVAPLFWRRGFGLLRTAKIGRHAARGAVHALGVMLWFYAAARMPIANVTALSFISPIFVAVGAAVFLDERMSLLRTGAILLGIAGVLVVLRPGTVAISSATIAILLAAPFFAASKLLTKSLVSTDSSGTVVAYLSIFATLTMLPPAVYLWQTPSLADCLLLAATAVFATVSHLCMARGLMLIDVTVAQPVEFLQLVWSTLLGIVLFGEQPSLWVWLGSAIVVLSASFMARGEAGSGVSVARRAP